MSTAVKRRLVPTSTHWGTYWAEVEGDRLIAVHDYAGDPAPAIIGPGIVDAVTHDTRIRRPMVRKGWLEKRAHSDRAGRGREPFVAVPWDAALAMAAAELERIQAADGHSGFDAGTYGWAGGARSNHANPHITPLLNTH